MKKTIMKLVFELMKDSKRSDRELLQPTVSRRRSSLVKKGMIKEFTVIPDFVELGYEIMAISCINTKTAILTESEGKAEKYLKKYPNVISVSSAHGMAKKSNYISTQKLHRLFQLPFKKLARVGRHHRRTRQPAHLPKGRNC